MSPADELLLEQVLSAHRERGADGSIRAHRAWFDLDDAGRDLAFHETLTLRRLEAGLDREGASSTVRAVLARLRT